MGFGLILAGMIFFFNPNINCLDLLFDFIGCLFIIAGLSKLSLIDEDLAFARKKAFHFIFISLLRLAFSLFIYSGNSDYALSFSFIFGVLDIMFLLSFFKHLYSGIDYTTKRLCDCVNLKKVSEAYTMSFIFVVSTRVLDFIPHSLDLIKQNEELNLNHDAAYKMPIYQIKPYVNVICFTCSLIIGVIFLYVTATFFVSLIKNKQYTNALKDMYEQRLVTERDVIVNKKLSTTFICLIIGFVFLADFSIDAVNFLPDFVCVCLFFGALCCASGIINVKKPFVLLIASLIVGILSYTFSTYVSLGTNYNFGTETFLSKQVGFLSSPTCLVLGAIIYLGLYSLIATIYIYTLGIVKRVFLTENRKNLTGLLTVSKISLIISLCICFLSKMSETLIGHLSSNEFVSEYISSKYLISSEQIYNQYMQNALVRNFESALSFDTAVYICALIGILWNIIYINRIRRFSGE